MTERPVFSECVIGYRSWKLDDWVLSPISFGSPWRPGINRAVCKVHDTILGSMSFTLTTGGITTVDESQPRAEHSAPKRDCTCGLHAYHEMPEHADGIVVGAVAAWGDLQVHSNGFRAECAQILALVAADGLGDVAETYGVPLVPRDMLAAEAQQHGSPLPASMRPDPPKPQESVWTAGGYLRGGLYGQIMPTTWSIGPAVTAPHIHVPAISFGLTSDLWTPAEDKGKTAEDRLAKYRKAPANRQGPPKPKRGPKKLGGAR